MATADDEATVVLTDPRAIRAVAHPARVMVIDALYDQGLELTATQAARLAGASPSAMSYHLRALERFGIVRRAAPAADGRERPWVRAGRELAIRPSADGSTAVAAATDAVLSAAMTYARDRLLTAIHRSTSDERIPLDAVAGYRHTTVVVTPDEAVQLAAAIDAVIDPLRVRQRADPPDGAGHLSVTVALIPDFDHPGA